MKYEIEINEVPAGKMYMYQNGFTLYENDKEIISFNTIVPSGSPYILIKEGVNKGKRFVIQSKELQKLCEFLYKII